MAHGLVELWWRLVERHCEATLYCGGRRRGVPGRRSDDFADRLPPGRARATENGRVQVIFRLIMSVLGEASFENEGRDIAQNGLFSSCIGSHFAFCRTWNWERGLFSEPVVLEVILARSEWLAST